MVIHDLASLNTVYDRVAALADGKIVAIGPMHELLQSEQPWVRPPRSGSTEAIFSSSLRATDFTQECQHPLPGG